MIVTFNSAGTILDCLRSLSGESVIVVDNASRDDTVDRIEAAGGGVRVVRLHENHGFAYAANVGFALAAPADVVLINPDAFLAPGVLDRLAASAEDHGAGLVAPRLLNPDGTVQDSARTFPSFARLLARRTPLSRTGVGERLLSDHLEPKAGEGTSAVDWVIGAVMYIPRRSLDRVGPFDERFFLYGEDVDLCARLWRSGLPVLLDRDCTATHAYARASKRTLDLRLRQTRQHWLSIAKLAAKYPAPFWLGTDVQRTRAGARSPRASQTATRSGHQGHGLAGRPHLRGEVVLPLLAVERAWQMIRLYDNWPLAIADRMGLVRGRQVVYLVRHDLGRTRLVARANGCDVRTINEIWAGELYTRLLRGEPSRNKPIVVDIGANCGYFAVYASRRLPGARVVCFEPENENRRLAAINAASNGVDAEIRGEAVVVDGRSSVDLHLSHDPRLHTTVERQDADRHGIDTERYTGAKVSVPATNINAALRPILERDRIAVMKIDVEGLDLELVAALDDDVLAGVDYLVVETEGRDTIPVAKRLVSAGFSVVEDTNLLMALRNRDGVE